MLNGHSNTRPVIRPLRRPAVKYVLLILVAYPVFVLSSADAQSSRPPNIVLIMADDMGYECVSANGGTSYSTPVLDELARTGMRFEHCHVQPLCTPTRVQLMTGLSNHRNYIRFGILDPHATTFAHRLKDAGYRTCIAGKWQLLGGLDGPGHFGFDEYCLWQLTRRPSRYPNPGLEINGEEIDFTDGQYGPDIASGFICEFIRDSADEPFFVYYPMILPHWPFEPTPDSDDWDPTAEGVLKGQGNRRYFADMVAYTDKMVGKIVDTLEETGRRDDTLVIFLGDNGTAVGITSMMGDTAVPGGKGKTTDNGTHVPLIANWPSVVPAGTVNGDLIASTDFFPTLMEVAGIEDATTPDGRSFAPQLRGEPGTPREWIYCWYERNGKRTKASQHIRNQQFKLYRDGRFYDVVADLEESNPLSTEDLSDDAAAAHRMFLTTLREIEVPKTPIPGNRP
ncbi:MAG: arylsulfatase [Planctomycetota bacterium]|nr:MAG: arylsulfatase [Planctomycetota bacterium]REJ87040.1 MAG: arylsulfatase [Planctomycetota bacterium]REK25859.1 MAG: arylsulfatase [Planctomycetota bacterium]REK37138.1 MAG: arylsulfatase [Planctomycetota bacterium]